MNPAVKVRQISERAILDLSAQFGLDPQSRYKLLRDQQLAPVGGLFDRPTTEPEEPQTKQESSNPIGLMSSLSSAPPGSPLN